MVHLHITALKELVSQRLCGNPRIRKDQRRSLAPEHGREHFNLLFEGFPGKLHRKIQLLGNRNLHDREWTCAAEESPNFIGISDRRREPDALEVACIDNEALECHGQLGSPLATRKFVNFINDDIPYAGKVAAQAPAHEQRLQRLWCRDKEIRRAECLPAPFRCGRITVPDTDGEREFTAPPFHPGKDITVE